MNLRVNVKNSNIFSRLRYLFRTRYNNISRIVRKMANAGYSGAKRGGGIQKSKKGKEDPNFEDMTQEEIRAFFETLEPEVTDEELEKISRNLYPRIVDQILREDSEKERKHQSVKRWSLVAIVICSLLTVSIIAQALGIPLWTNVVQWTEEHFIMQFFASPNARENNDSSNEGISAEERIAWGDEVCEILAEMSSVPNLPTWKPEGFRLEMVDVFEVSNAGMLLSVAYCNSDEEVLMLTVQELPEQNMEYNIEFERNTQSGKVENHNGIQYYYMENKDQYMVTWQKDGVVLDISGDITEQDARRMIESIVD